MGPERHESSTAAAGGPHTTIDGVVGVLTVSQKASHRRPATNDSTTKYGGGDARREDDCSQFVSVSVRSTCGNVSARRPMSTFSRGTSTAMETCRKRTASAMERNVQSGNHMSSLNSDVEITARST